MKRWLRRLGKTILGLCVFWTLVHLLEDWRGKQAWEAWKQDQITKGAVYDLSKLQGPPILDADNFAKAPIVQGVFALPGRPLFPPDFKLAWPKDPSAYSRNWRVGQAMNLTPWTEANHSTDLLAILGPASPQLKECEDATRLPNSRFELHEENEDPLFPGLITIRLIARILNLRAVVRLRAGKSEEALQDVLAELRLARKLSTPYEMDVNFAQLSIVSIPMQAIWEGLETHTWNDAQLTSLQEELAHADELTPFVQWGLSEKISANQYWSGLVSSSWNDKSHPLGSLLVHTLIPRGWLYRNMLEADRHMAETWLVAADPGAHRMYPDKVEFIASWWDQRRSTPYTFLAKDISSIAAGAMAAQAKQFADRQVSLDEAYIVCALERYRLTHKAYPDSLDALVPACAAKLPCDVFTGTPLHYARKGDSFTLYSVGWNGTDEGGLMAMEGQNRDLSKGDWPWPQRIIGSKASAFPW